MLNYIFSFLFLCPDCFIHHFKKYQDLPTKRADAVEHFTINGSLFLAFANSETDTDPFIYKFNDSTGKFFLHQTILRTKGAMDVEYFTISNEHYLGVVNSHLSKHDYSVIYRWNGQSFAAFQNVTVKEGKFSFFTLDKEAFLAAFTYNPQCIIYKWKNNTFEKIQMIALLCAKHDVFVINNESYLAVSDLFFRTIVYRWSGKKFSKLQTLQVAFSLKFLYDNDDMFLALASGTRGPGFFFSITNYVLNVYKWNGTQFMLFYSIPTVGEVSFLHSFVMCGQTFLGLTERSNTKTTLYLFSYGKLTKYQEISTFEASDMTSFEYKGHTYLAIANEGNFYQPSTKNSTLYKRTTRMFMP